VQNREVIKNIHNNKIESNVEINFDSSNSKYKDIVCSITNRTFHLINYYDYYKNGSANGISYITETSKQKIKNNTFSDSGTITLEVNSPDTYPVDSLWNFNKKNWTKSFNSNEIEYGRNYIKLISRKNSQLPRVNKLIEYYSGSENIEYTSNLIGIEDPNEKFYEFKLIGYLERPNFEKNESSSNLYGILTVFSPHTRKKQILKIYNELDLYRDFNFYENYKFKTVELVGDFDKKKKAREINEIDIIDTRYNGNINNYSINLVFDGIHEEIVSIPVRNSKILFKDIKNKNFTYEYFEN
jgi:hypothetical protein